ncbi:cx9C motif-containing protein 4 [Ascaphus truei]|uniref:cx9C motif-containing protein 4 n=1 Tax=Ascaphus truei TaxID=8439 RepID=UPI003F5A79E5
MSPQKDPCQRQACAIQRCLQAHSYMERMCEAELQAMHLCCSKYTAQQSPCCSGFQNQHRAESEPQHSRSEGGTQLPRVSSSEPQ